MAALYPALGGDNPVLRVGVMLDDLMAPAWVSEILQSIVQSGIARITTVILNATPRQAPVSRTQKLWNLVSGKSDVGLFLWKLYVRLDEKQHSDLFASFQPTELSEALGDVATVRVLPGRVGAVHRFSAADVAAVKKEDLDVVLRFGFGILHGDILSAARYGIWSYHHGDNHQYRGGPAGFWEMYERNPLTGVVLQILNEELDGGQVIYRSFGATESFESLAKNRISLYRKAIPFVVRCLRRVYQLGDAGLGVEPSIPYTKRLYRLPRNGKMLFFLGTIFLQLVLSKLKIRQEPGPDHWFLACAAGHETRPGHNLSVVEIHAPDGHFWADPKVIRHKEKHHIFFEDFDYVQQRGNISVLSIAPNGEIGSAQTVLNTGKHLSYPFVFEWQGTHYLVPESASERAIKLYRAVDFPYQWVLESVLLDDIVAVDATIFEQEGMWYLFTNVSESGGSTWDELFLFVAESPLGPWHPHPMNPVVSDVQAARPAGALFRKDGVLYRPAQNCTLSYGGSIAVQRVMTLSPTHYRECPGYTIKPTWLPDIHGCHTMSLTDEISVFDCKAKRGRHRPVVLS